MCESALKYLPDGCWLYCRCQHFGSQQQNFSNMFHSCRNEVWSWCVSPSELERVVDLRINTVSSTPQTLQNGSLCVVPRETILKHACVGIQSMPGFWPFATWRKCRCGINLLQKDIYRRLLAMFVPCLFSDTSWVVESRWNYGNHTVSLCLALFRFAVAYCFLFGQTGVRAKNCPRSF